MLNADITKQTKGYKLSIAMHVIGHLSRLFMTLFLVIFQTVTFFYKHVPSPYAVDLYRYSTKDVGLVNFMNFYMNIRQRGNNGFSVKLSC